MAAPSRGTAILGRDRTFALPIRGPLGAIPCLAMLVHARCAGGASVRRRLPAQATRLPAALGHVVGIRRAEAALGPRRARRLLVHAGLLGAVATRAGAMLSHVLGVRLEAEREIECMRRRAGVGTGDRRLQRAGSRGRGRGAAAQLWQEGQHARIDDTWHSPVIAHSAQSLYSSTHRGGASFPRGTTAAF